MAMKTDWVGGGKNRRSPHLSTRRIAYEATLAMSPTQRPHPIHRSSTDTDIYPIAYSLVAQADRRGPAPDRQAENHATGEQSVAKDDSRRGFTPDRPAVQNHERKDDSRRGFTPDRQAARRASREMREEQDLAETLKEATETDSLKNSDVNGQVMRKA